MARRSTITQVRFRLRDGLLQALARAAEGNDRSLNDEVERRLERSFTIEEALDRAQQTAQQKVDDLQRRLDENMKAIQARLDVLADEIGPWVETRGQRRPPRRKAKQEKAR
jgi:hypothetical protein